MKNIFLYIIILAQLSLLLYSGHTAYNKDSEEESVSHETYSESVLLPPQPPKWKNKYADYQKQKRCLVRNVFYEGPRFNHTKHTEQDFENITYDRVKIINVTLNRVKSDIYPNDICSTVYQYKQFSWTLDKKKVNNPIRQLYKNNKIELENLRLVEKMVDYALVYGIKDYTNGSLYYHTHEVSPYWKDTKRPTVATQWHKYYKN